MTNVDKREDGRSLQDLAGEINRAHAHFRKVFKATFRTAIQVGELLIEAKGKVKHGEWLAWVEKNCEFSERTARTYMQLARNREQAEEMLKSAESADLSIDQILGKIALSSAREGVPYVATPPDELPPMPEMPSYEDRQYRDYLESGPGQKARWLALQLVNLFHQTTARKEDLPQRNPLKGVLTDMEWRQVLASVEHYYDGLAVGYVNGYAKAQKGSSFDMRNDLRYVLSNAAHADITRIEDDAKVLRGAEENYRSLALALEEGMKDGAKDD
jgi:hypothetical protein